MKHYGEAALSVDVWLRLKDGTVISTNPFKASLRTIVETVNRNYTTFTQNQLTMLKAMIEANPVMKQWSVDNIYQ